MLYVFFFVVFSFVAAAAAYGAADPKTNPREKPGTAIPEAIRLLEAKDYATFLKTFVVPDEYKRIAEKKSLEEFARRFGEDKAPYLLKVLQSIRNAKPELDADGKKASYKFDDGKKTITFVKIDKYWYIQNK